MNFIAKMAGDRQALDMYRRFKWAVVTKLPKNRWMLNSQVIDHILRNIRNYEAEGVVA